MTLSPEEEILLENLKKARGKAEATKELDNPCTPESHKSLVDVIVQQVDVSLLSYKKQDKIYDKLNEFMQSQANNAGKIAIPKTWSDTLRLFILKSPVPFAFIVVAVLCWFMYSNVHPKDLAPAAKEAVAEVVER